MLTTGLGWTVVVTVTGMGQNPGSLGVAVKLPETETVMDWVLEPFDQVTSGEEAVSTTLPPWQKVVGPDVPMLSRDAVRLLTVTVSVTTAQFVLGPRETVHQ